MKRIPLLILLMIVFFCFASAYPGGRTGTTLKSGTSGCGSCHGSSTTASVLAVISGPTQMYTGQKANFTLTVSGGPGAGSGCDIAVLQGVLTPISTFMTLNGGEIVQNTSTAFSGGSIAYQFSYTAPVSAGTDTIYSTGYSSNRTQSSGVWNWGPNKAITIIVPTNAPATPAFITPASGATNTNTTLLVKWNTSSGAASYRLQVSTDQAFSTFVIDAVVSDTVKLVRYLTSSTKYYSRVNATNTQGTSEWSSILEFTTTAQTAVTGTKTIGGATPDYMTIKAAIKDLNARGTAPPGVTFLIRDGSYLEDSLLIQTNTSGSTAPITVKPDAGANVIINDSGSAAMPFVFKIDSTSNVTIDGSNNGTSSRNLIVNGLGVNVQKGIWINSQSYNTTVKNCIVRAGAATASTYRAIDLLPGVASGTNANFTLVENNVLRNAYTGIRAYGKAAGDSLIGLMIRGNVIDSIGNAGVYTSYLANAQICNNDIAMMIGSSASMYGIYIGTGCDFVRIYANKVHDINQLSPTSTTAGIYCSVGSASHGGTSVFNNFVYINPSSTGTGIIYGISMYETSNLYPDTVVYNSVKIFGSSAGIRQSVAIYRASSTGTAGVFFRNNNVQNIRTDAGGAYTAIGKTGVATAMSSDYNNLSVSTADTSHAIGRINATNPVLYRTIADWRGISGGDSSSISVNPQFTSNTDLHIPNGTATQIEGHGIPVPGIATDIDGNPRNSQTPDIGADEFTGVTDVNRTSTSLPSEFVLEQNFPNPFNPSTEIRYQLPASSFVMVTVFDILGKEIASLVNEKQEAGFYHVQFNAGSLSSGMYFYRIRADDFVQIKKMILIK